MTWPDIAFGALAAVLVIRFVFRRTRKPRWQNYRPERTDAELAAKRLKTWQAYEQERAGGKSTSPADPPKQENLSEDEPWW